MAFTLAWRGFVPGRAQRPQHRKARQSLEPLSQRPLVSVTPPTDCVPFTSSQLPVMWRYWDYVENALHGAGAYTPHHMSDSHWDACNTSPALPDKPSILPFILQLFFLCVISHQSKGGGSLWKNKREQIEMQRQLMVLIFMHTPYPCMFCMLYALRGARHLIHP